MENSNYYQLADKSKTLVKFDLPKEKTAENIKKFNGVDWEYDYYISEAVKKAVTFGVIDKVARRITTDAELQSIVAEKIAISLDPDFN